MAAGDRLVQGLDMGKPTILHKKLERNQSFFEHAEIRDPRVLDPLLTSSLWTLLFTIPTVMAAATINIAYQSKFGFLVEFAVLHMFVTYLATVLAGLVIGVPLFRLLERNRMQFGFLYLIAGFIVYGFLFVYVNIAMHMGLHDYLTAEYGDVFQRYERGIQAFNYLWLGFAFLGMAIALTAWARLIKE